MSRSSNAVSSLGLRNWRGQIVEPLANFAAASDVAPPEDTTPADARPRPREDGADGDNHAKKHSKKRKSRRDRPTEGDAHDGDAVAFVKDEFGRDVPVERARKRERKKSKKHRKRSRSRSASSLREAPGRRRRASTPPPADPFRPQLDEDRDRPRRRQERSRSRERSRDRPRRQGDRSRSRSRSRSRRGSRRRSRSESVDRAWTHDGFANRSPSPMREVDPRYNPEPEQWVSRAGGVYVPRKST